MLLPGCSASHPKTTVYRQRHKNRKSLYGSAVLIRGFCPTSRWNSWYTRRDLCSRL